MKNSMHFQKRVIAVCFMLLGAGVLHAQSYTYPEYTMEGDTIIHAFPPPDSTYVPNEIILKFLDGTLNKDSLCYDCTIAREKGRHIFGDPTTDFADCKETLMTQQFSLDIISDPDVRVILAMNGVMYLKRMTAANPCADSLSLSRYNDTLRMDHYNWMVAEFNNDTSVIPTLTSLFITHDGTVQIAEPNYYLYAEGTPPRTPIDPQYHSGLQKSLEMIGMATAWGFDVGEASIIVAVVDVGADYWRCDLGGGPIPNPKIIGGWDYPDNDLGSLYHDSFHGTAVASIIGALTNNSCTARTDTANGMAGIAGGYNGAEGTPNLGTGVKLVTYNIGHQSVIAPPWVASYVASAILAASAHSLSSPYGDSADLINLSGGYTDSLGNEYSITVRNALSEAWKNGVTFVCGEEDNGLDTITYPPYYEPSSEEIVVTGSDTNKSRQPGVNWGFHTDLLAPGGVGNISDALQWDSGDSATGASGNPDQFFYFGKSSAATPHVTGVAALLRGWMNTNGIAFAREDIKGMLDASALDLGDPLRDHFFPPPRKDPDSTQYITGFDDHGGWGFLQADSLFTMLDPIGNYQYRLFHVEIPFDSLKFPVWDSALDYKNVVIYTSTPDTLPDTVGIFDVKMREITGTYSYAFLGINRSDSVYVWGNSGIGLWDTVHRGMANVLPNWSEPWCGVTSGLLGNQGVRIPKDTTTYLNIGVPGIHHGYSTEVTCHTYQYQLFKHGDTVPIRSLPTDSELGLGYTVFGATKFPADVRSSNSTDAQFNVWPSIATTTVHVVMENSETASHFVLFDEIGGEVFEQSLLPGTTQFEVPVSDLPSGFFIARVIATSGVEEAKFVVQH